MAKQKYKEIRFQSKTLQLIGLINDVAEEYQEKGYVLTLRQMYYQLVARGYIENSQRSYKNVGKTISDGRTAGLIDWNIIIDRLRGIRGQDHEESPVYALAKLSESYSLNKWRGQPNYVEVWVEKDALIDVVGRACNAIDTPYTSDRGYTSTTEIRNAAQRFINHSDKEGRYIIYLGDHDPSGVDMTRDIKDRLELFGANVEVRRIALTMEQIRTYNPPPAFAKTGDARTPKYIKEHGLEAWELDALDPEVLHDLIQSEVESLIDVPLYNAFFDQEQEEREELLSIARNYSEVQRLLKQA